MKALAFILILLGILKLGGCAAQSYHIDHAPAAVNCDPHAQTQNRACLGLGED